MIKTLAIGSLALVGAFVVAVSAYEASRAALIIRGRK